MNRYFVAVVGSLDALVERTFKTALDWGQS